MSGTKWEPMKVYLNTSDGNNYIRFGSDSDKEVPLYAVKVSPQKKKLGGFAARNTEGGHEDALVFRAESRKYFLSHITDLMNALRDTDVEVADQPYSQSRGDKGGGKKKRHKYSKKYTKRRKSNKRKSKTKRRRRR